MSDLKREKLVHIIFFSGLQFACIHALYCISVKEFFTAWLKPFDILYWSINRDWYAAN